jgi:hypothetical protein
MFRIFNRPLTTRRKDSTYRPRLQILEDRTVPTTLTVTSTADSGTGSLRAAIAAAHNGDTIDFAHDLSGKTIHLSTELAFGTSLDIKGPGADHLTISGDDVTRVFDLTGGATTIADLTIADGLVTGQLPSSMVGVFAGTGSGAGGGGGILNQAGAILTLERDTIRGNTASGAVGFTEVGGGLLNLGTATVQSCHFTDNHAVGGGALDAIGGSAGGAIDNFGGPTGGAKLTVDDSTFFNNSAVAAGNGLYFGIGGALENNAGLNGYTATLASPATAALYNCTIKDNLATGGTGALADGGGLLMEGFGTNLKLVDCTVTGNRAIGGDDGTAIASPTAPTGDSQATAGGIGAAAGVCTIVDCAITDNQAIGGNGATITPIDPEGGAYGGGAFGGGIENNFADVLNISGSLIANNTARGGSTSVGPGGMAVGGGISNSPSATMNMTDCVVRDNRAVAGHGGPGVNAMLGTLQAGFAFGGGIDISNNLTGTPSSATILDSTIVHNQAIGGEGGTGNDGGNGYGGGIGVGWGPFLGLPDGAQLTLEHSTVAGNRAVGGAGGAGANGGNGEGGGLFISSAGSATLTASILVHNHARGGQAGSGGHDGNGFGGGVCYDVGSVFLEDGVTVIKHNHASTAGDDIYLL